jgi:hypothetical protein
MAENNLMTASVSLEIDPAKAMASADRAAKQLQTKLNQNNAKLSAQLTNKVIADTDRLFKAANMASTKLSGALGRGVMGGIGLGTSSVFSFLKTGTPDALRFRDSLDRVRTSWARVGGILATKIRFGDRTASQWVETLVSKLERLDTSQIEKAVGYFKVMAGIWASFKGLSILASTGSMVTELTKAVRGMQAASTGSTVAGAALAGGTAAVGTGVVAATSINDRLVLNAMYKLSKAKPGAEGMEAAFKALGASIRSSTPGGAKMSSKTVAELIFRSMDSIGGTSMSMRSKVLNAGKYGAKALGPIALGYDAYGEYRERGAKSAVGLTAANVGGTMLGGKIGAAIGTAIAPGVGTAIGALVGSIGGYISASAGWKSFMRYTSGADQAQSVGEGAAASARARQYAVEGAFLGQAPDLNRRTASFFRDQGLESGAYSQSNPYRTFQQRQFGVRRASGLLSENTGALAGLRKQYDELDPGNALRTTLNEQIKIVEGYNTQLRDYIQANIQSIDSATEANKDFARSMAKFDRDVSRAIEGNRRAERDDKQEIKKATAAKKPEKGTLSSGGVEDLPSIIAQAVNEQANNQETLLKEQVEKADELRELLEKQDEARRDREEALLDLQKEKADADKAFQDAQLKASETTAAALKRTGLQSSTVTTETTL